MMNQMPLSVARVKVLRLSREHHPPLCTLAMIINEFYSATIDVVDTSGPGDVTQEARTRR